MIRLYTFYKKVIRPYFLAIVMAIVFRSLVYEPFHIPSGSMRGTLVEGDYVFVSKYAYGYSKYSFPFSFPPFSGRLFYKQPERGDIVVFRPKNHININYIKRVMGLPGDKIQIKSGIVYINGKAIETKKVEDYITSDVYKEKTAIPQYMESLENGYYHLVLDQVPNSVMDNTQEYLVPENHFFVLGDNRDNSRDSRFQDDIGFVSYENLVGRADIIISSFPKKESGFFGVGVDKSRFFKRLYHPVK